MPESQSQLIYKNWAIYISTVLNEFEILLRQGLDFIKNLKPEIFRFQMYSTFFFSSKMTFIMNMNQQGLFLYLLVNILTGCYAFCLTLK